MIVKPYPQNTKRCSVLLLLGIITLVAVGCSKSYRYNYQVVSVKSSLTTPASENLVFENQDLKLEYDLWSDEGSLGFLLYNKTDKLLFLDLKRSFFVKNGVAKDYYENKTRTNSQTIGNQVNVTNDALNSVSSAETAKEEISVKVPETIAIPPKSAKELAYFSLKEEVFEFCSLKKYTDNKDTAQIASDPKNAPMSFENYLTYQVNTPDTNSKTIRNQFWVNQVINLHGSQFTTVKEVKDPCNNRETKEVVVTEERKSHRFYIRYVDDSQY